MHEITKELQFWLDSSLGLRSAMFQGEDVKGLLKKSREVAWSSPEGMRLAARVGARFNARIEEELKKRFDNDPQWPGVYWPERVIEVMHDLLVEIEEPNPQEQVIELPKKVEPPKEKVLTAEEIQKKQEKELAELRSLAHFVNTQIRDRGIRSIKPIDGIVTIWMDGKPYEYPYVGKDGFGVKFEKMNALGLVR